MEPSKPFPIYQLQDAFEAFCNNEPSAKPQHRSLYYFLLGYCRRRGNAPRFNLAYEVGMHGSGIGSWATYDAALKALAEWGFIVYTPGANRYKVPVVELTFRNPTDDVLLTYWQSYCLSTANPTDDVLANQLVTLKEVLNKESLKAEKLESEKSLIQAEVSAANAALAAANELIAQLQKKSEQLAAENAAMLAQPQASHTEGAEAAPVELALPPPEAAPSKPAKQPKGRRTIPNRRPEVAFAESELADYQQFAAAFEGTDYELLDLAFYHQKILNWRQKGETPLRKDWKATATQFFLNDRESNSLKLAPNVERYDAGTHGAIGSGNAVGPRPAPTGQGATGYRSSRYD